MAAAATAAAGDLAGLDPWLGSASVLAGGTFAPGGLGRGLRTTGDAMVGGRGRGRPALGVMMEVEVKVRPRGSLGVVDGLRVAAQEGQRKTVGTWVRSR